VYLALLRDRQLRLHYMKRDARRATVYESVHPLAIVQRGGLIYLVAMFGDYDDVRTIALHRLQLAEMRYEAARASPGFSLDAYIASGQFGVIAGDPIRLHAVFSRAAGEHLYETPLVSGQVLETGDNGAVRLTATVPHTRSLVWWLLGFGDGVEVLEPAALREEMARTTKRMAEVYA
jgi:predicted DNA-binding transcriptional regulator YafY